MGITPLPPIQMPFVYKDERMTFIILSIYIYIIMIFIYMNKPGYPNSYDLSPHTVTNIQTISGFIRITVVDPYHAKLINLKFHPLEVEAENYSYMFNLSTHICKS